MNNDLQPGIPYKYHLKLTGYKFGTKAGEGRHVENNELKINDEVTITGAAARPHRLFCGKEFAGPAPGRAFVVQCFADAPAPFYE